ncbi:hypothetical protein CSKR_202105 [Clonorchis sinensis]|uniref:Uncharacterized protein n=1 Tax=Clonorchis sinensis TaxID=79923 RepID=A0A8T1LXI3_CLOSI|nr:hypothetical protein CSKR_202105 [Clonorchis sinensis]
MQRIFSSNPKSKNTMWSGIIENLPLSSKLSWSCLTGKFYHSVQMSKTKTFKGLSFEALGKPVTSLNLEKFLLPDVTIHLSFMHWWVGDRKPHISDFQESNSEAADRLQWD